MDKVKDTLVTRGSRYGSFEGNATLTQTLYHVFLEAGGNELSDMHREAVHMIFHKIARMTLGDAYYADNAHDIAGYAQLLEEHMISMNNKLGVK